MPKPHLYLCTLYVDRGAHPEYDVSLANTVAYAARTRAFDLTLSRLAIGDNCLRQLNRRVAHFLTTDCDYFWLQGSDTDWDPAYIHRMATRGQPIVAGRFPIKQPELRWCYQPLPDFKINPAAELGAILQGGLECLLIHRDVFLAWQKARPEDMYHSQFADFAPEGNPARDLPEWHFWQWCIREDSFGKRRLMSEDYFFSHTARELGISILIDQTGYCGHWDGRTRYPLAEPHCAISPERNRPEQAASPEPVERAQRVEGPIILPVPLPAGCTPRARPMVIRSTSMAAGPLAGR